MKQKSLNENTVQKNISDIKAQAHLKLHDKNPDAFEPGKTMPLKLPVMGNIIAWDDYIKTLAYQQFRAGVGVMEFHPEYRQCIEYYRSTPQKMQVFRYLYLCKEERKFPTLIDIVKKTKISKPAVTQALKESIQAGWVQKEKYTYFLSEHGFHSFRHYASKWWEETRHVNLAGQFYRLWHSLTQEATDDDIRKLTLLDK